MCEPLQRQRTKSRPSQVSNGIILLCALCNIIIMTLVASARSNDIDIERGKTFDVSLCVECVFWGEGFVTASYIGACCRAW